MKKLLLIIPLVLLLSGCNVQFGEDFYTRMEEKERCNKAGGFYKEIVESNGAIYGHCMVSEGTND